MQVVRRPLLSFEFQRGVKEWLAAAQAVGLNYQRISGCVEGPLIFAVHLQEWRNVELLAKLILLTVCSAAIR